MNGQSDRRLVSTIKEKCRVCYHCVRECPAKAIRITDGQAEILVERCIGCGNCVRVCSQKAKVVFDTIEALDNLLSAKTRLPSGPPDDNSPLVPKIAACLAPSFPAEFTDLDYTELVGMLRAMGFDLVHEVAFGADLVSLAYCRLLQNGADRKYIATTCPAIVNYVEKYHPEVLHHLAPIVSPMVAAARVIRRLYGPDMKVVFFGPCIAKKAEAWSDELPGEIDAALTFVELRRMLTKQGFIPDQLATGSGSDESDQNGKADIPSSPDQAAIRTVPPSEFDYPHAGYGALYPVSRGFLQSANISEDLVTGEVVAADGHKAFVEAIREFEMGALDARLLEVLSCHGCISGAGMTCNLSLFHRRSRISEYVRRRMEKINREKWLEDIQYFQDLDLSRRFQAYDQRMESLPQDEIKRALAGIGKLRKEDELDCGACGYDTCRGHAEAIIRGLAETEMCLPYAIEQLRVTVDELAQSNVRLADVQEALMQSEKLASMGQLAAGVAHEVNNPLGVVLMYAHLLLDELSADSEIRPDVAMIAAEADRCKRIVSGLLQFARQNKAIMMPTNILSLVERTLVAAPPPPEVDITVLDEIADPIAHVDGDQIIQVLTNLLTNAYAALGDGGKISIAISGDDARVSFAIEDNGVGISQQNMSKLFTPFFTTKQIGKGTGLGLAISYGIIKMHRGDITVRSNADPAAGATGTVFTINIPRRAFEEKILLEGLPPEESAGA
ncbi:MAG: [Fe-Fe] hydrogenase large subunit C-terminal domain-containing protein [Smithellaceae bacterium]|nr:[Fe-Fe] hydrogenase large subunit C-terminal domain-containing protein [Smithellaceae bacterium]